MTRAVVWDVDDVLNDLTRSWLHHWQRSVSGRAPTSYEDLDENPPDRILGLTREEYLSSLDAFRLSELYRDEVPEPAILDWLREHGAECRHMALTATTLDAAPTSASWVLRHFGRWIREFAVIPAGRPGDDLPAYDRDKGSWIGRQAGPVVLVDDSPDNVAAARMTGGFALLWPRPWNDAGRTVHETLALLTRFARGGSLP